MPVNNPTSVHISDSPAIAGEVVLAQGSGVTLSQSGKTITIAASGGPGASWSETEVDFGAKPVRNKRFTVTDAAVTVASKVIVTPSGNAPTGRARGDWEWDTGTAAAIAGTGNFILYATFEHAVVGKRKYFYQVA